MRVLHVVGTLHGGALLGVRDCAYIYFFLRAGRAGGNGVARDSVCEAALVGVGAEDRGNHADFDDDARLRAKALESVADVRTSTGATARRRSADMSDIQTRCAKAEVPSAAS